MRPLRLCLPLLICATPWVAAQIQNPLNRQLLTPDPSLRTLANNLLKLLTSPQFPVRCTSLFRNKRVDVNELLRYANSEVDFYYIGVTSSVTGTSKPFGLTSWAELTPGNNSGLMGIPCIDTPRNGQNNPVQMTSETDLTVPRTGGVRYAVSVCPSFFGPSEPSRRSTVLHEMMHVYLHHHPTLMATIWEDDDVREFLMGHRQPRNPALSATDSRGRVIRPYTYDITKFFTDQCVEIP